MGKRVRNFRIVLGFIALGMAGTLDGVADLVLPKDHRR
jgi:hypothetical protein